MFQIKIEKQYLQLEPIGFVFLIFFGILLVVQFVAMLLHRFGTFCQILANTHINVSCGNKSVKFKNFRIINFALILDNFTISVREFNRKRCKRNRCIKISISNSKIKRYR